MFPSTMLRMNGINNLHWYILVVRGELSVRGESVEPHPSTMLRTNGIKLSFDQLSMNGINKVRGDLYVHGEPIRILPSVHD